MVFHATCKSMEPFHFKIQYRLAGEGESKTPPRPAPLAKRVSGCDGCADSAAARASLPRFATWCATARCKTSSKTGSPHTLLLRSSGTLPLLPVVFR